MKRPGSFRGEGITLLELLAIVAVLAILSRAALPDFSDVLENSLLAAVANGVVRALALLERCAFCAPLGARRCRGVRFVKSELDGRDRFRIVEETEGCDV